MLQKMQLEHVRRATNRLLRPWKEERGASSVGSVGSVLVTSASGVPRGKRHRFRVTAAEFRPDPLNQPGGRGLSSLGDNRIRRPNFDVFFYTAQQVN